MATDLLDVEEAAGFCHIKTATMRSWVYKGQIPYVKLGRRVFLRRQDLERLIADSVVPVQPRTAEAAPGYAVR